MPEEYLDIVNEEDIVIGRAPREEIMARRLYRRVVDIFLVNTSGEILLQRRSHHKKVCPNVWCNSAGGHVDSGEAYDTAAVRETSEELGIHTDHISLTEVAYLTPQQKQSPEFGKIYLGRYDGLCSPNPEEVSAVRWISLAALLDELQTTPEAFASSTAKIVHASRAALEKFCAL